MSSVIKVWDSTNEQWINIPALAGDPGVYIGTTAPTNPAKKIWIDPSGTANAISTDDVQFKIYNSVTDLGLTSGSATIADAFAAMPNYSILYAYQGEFVSGELPSGFYGYVWITRGVNVHRSSIEAKGSTAAYGDWRMFLDSSGVPTGTWNYVGLRKTVTYAAWDTCGVYRTDSSKLYLYLPAASLMYGTYNTSDYVGLSLNPGGSEAGVVVTGLAVASFVRSSPDMICVYINRPSTVSTNDQGTFALRGNFTITAN